MRDFQLFIDAIKSGPDEKIKRRFKIEFLEIGDKDMWRPIHYACRYGRIGLVRLLLSNHCEIDSRSNNGYQPIHLVCMNGYIDIVQILIANKCDINATTEFSKYQPIHFASENGHIDIVKILIANKCNISTSTKWGYQPIHLACKNYHIDIVKLLIANNCDMNALTKFGKSPLDIAKQKGYQQIIIDFSIESIAKAMDLHCNIGCNHNFCRKSLEDEAFKQGELIGSGTFANVYKYKISNTNREIVIKHTKYICEDKINIEVSINKFSKWIVHRNITRYFGALEKSGNLCVYMEYLPGGCLKNLIDKSRWIEHSKVIKFSKQILEGIQFLHSQGIIHKDIKPENMLLDHDDTLKLTDYDLKRSLRFVSVLESVTNADAFYGILNYVAPEVFLRRSYDFPADIWSTGASIIHMVTGKMPYYWLQPQDARAIIAITKKIEFTPCQPISETMQSFIDDLLTAKQSKRPTAEYLLKHSIFKDVK